MSDPVSFESVTPRLGLPLLFAGQAQKEVFVNEALAILDGITHAAVEGELASPPATPPDGQAWLIGAGASGEWAGRTGQVALRQSGQWLFLLPRDGLKVLDRSTGQDRRRAGGAWQTPSVPAAPSGGSVIDTQARATLTALIAALRQAGIFPL